MIKAIILRPDVYVNAFPVINRFCKRVRLTSLTVNTTSGPCVCGVKSSSFNNKLLVVVLLLISMYYDDGNKMCNYY